MSKSEAGGADDEFPSPSEASSCSSTPPREGGWNHTLLYNPIRFTAESCSEVNS